MGWMRSTLEATTLKESMTNDSVNYMRYESLIAFVMILTQQDEVTCPKEDMPKLELKSSAKPSTMVEGAPLARRQPLQPSEGH
ncbi:PSMD1-like protein [Mya arenaria]|uniref:PSMD1-like protein n=1 Tax=Mya arenaria TaxID=6604 RepID=A0ABY7G3N4_MYAAR|nr:PSMD1-like protein [Mya arenaria]